MPKLASIFGIGAILLAVGVHWASTALPPPAEPEADFNRPHKLEDYVRVPWYDEEPSWIDRRPALGTKKALITGGSSGIGRGAAVELCKLGIGQVIITSRSLERGNKAAKEMIADGSCTEYQVLPMAVDFSDLDDVRRFCAKVLAVNDRLDFLVLNAGGATDPKAHQFGYITKDGYEYSYAGNYLGQFLLLNMVLDLVVKSGPSPRIAVTSSIAHWLATNDLDALLPSGSAAKISIEGKSPLDAFQQYGNTKLVQILMCFELQKRLAETNNQHVTVTPLAPGFVNTDIFLSKERKARAKGDLVGIALSPTEGAKATLHALLSDAMEGKTGYFLQPYWSPLHQTPLPHPIFWLWKTAVWEGVLQKWTFGAHLWLPSPNAYRAEFAKRLWDESMEAVGLSSSPSELEKASEEVLTPEEGIDEESTPEESEEVGSSEGAEEVDSDHGPEQGASSEGTETI